MNLQNLVTSSKNVVNYIWTHREAVMIVIIAILLFFLLHHKPNPEQVIVKDPLTLDSLKQQRDINGKLYAVIAQKIVDERNQGHLIDSMAKALKIKPTTIQGATVVKIVVDTFWRDTGRVKLVLVGGDTAHIVQKHDSWVDIQAYAFLNPAKFGLDKIEFKYRDSLYFIETKKTHLFSPTEYDLIVRSASPYAKTVEGASYKVREKQPWLVLSAGVYYNPFATTWKFGPSLNLGYPILSLKK